MAVSDRVKSGPEKAPHRSLWKALGLTDEELKLPLIGVVSAKSECVPGHNHLNNIAQAKHAAPKHADPADYAHATGLEALWGYLYVTKQTDRLDTLIRLAIMRTEDIWHKQS